MNDNELSKRCAIASTNSSDCEVEACRAFRIASTRPTVIVGPTAQGTKF